MHYSQNVKSSKKIREHVCHTENCYVVFMDYNNASYEVIYTNMFAQTVGWVQNGDDIQHLSPKIGLVCHR